VIGTVPSTLSWFYITEWTKAKLGKNFPYATLVIMDSIEYLIAVIEKSIVAQTGKPLTFIQKAILRESLSEQKQTYAEIAQKCNYSEGYIKKVAAPQLWRLLSQVLNEKVNKYNCRLLLKQKLKNVSSVDNCQTLRTYPQFTLEFPEGHVPLNSPFYVERANLESSCDQEIAKPGAFLHIQAPRKMGKTSLATRIITNGRDRGFQTVYLNLEQVDRIIFSSIKQVCRWFCASVTQQLGIKTRLDDYWNDDMGALSSCTIYFQEYLLKQLSHPLLLILDEVEQIFQQPNITHDFLALLRSWHERSKDITLWQKLRLVIVNSTDVYLSLKINQSPFNVGLNINLPPFSLTEIEYLALQHRIELDSWELQQLREVTGGFPYLLRLVLYEIIKRNITFKTFLKERINETEIFNNQLHYLLWNLQKYQNLWSSFQQVLKSPINLETELAFKLASLGLVNLEGNKATVSCGLYQKYLVCLC
jgi:transcription termination factor NusB